MCGYTLCIWSAWVRKIWVFVTGVFYDCVFVFVGREISCFGVLKSILCDRYRIGVILCRNVFFVGIVFWIW